MLLSDLLGPVPTRATTLPIAGLDVRDLAYDSRRVQDGTLFFCVPGAVADGHDHAAAAVAAGACALVVERELPLPVPQIVVDSCRAAMGPIADVFFGRPSEHLLVLGVTGTNGKTTTAYLQHAILAAAGHAAGLLGTIERRIGGVVEPAQRTTSEAIDLHRDLRRMLDAGDTACAMEVSSHALDQQRVAGVRFAAAAFTNLTQDHLDYHADMEAYFAAKALLFDGRCPTAANADDAYGRRLPADLRFGLAAPDAGVRAEDVRYGAHGTAFRLHTPWGDAAVATRLVGRFNVENALAAVSSAGLAGVPLAAIVADGHVVGDHTWSHASLPSLKAPELKAEIVDTQTLIEQETGHKLTTMRPPFGDFTAKTNAYVRARGMLPVLWTIDSNDWALRDASTIAANVLNSPQLKPGAIILLHDGSMDRQVTVDALVMILDGLVARGLRSVTVPELMRLGPPSIARPGDYKLSDYATG